jgi:transposase
MFLGMPTNSQRMPASIESKLTAVILADPVSLDLDEVALDDETVILTVTSTQAEAPCPICGQFSSRVHSSYGRMPSDLALVGHRLRLRLHVRRFFCANPACARQTFAERLPGILKPFARRTNRLTETLCGIGQALGGEAGARRAAQLAMPVSPDTLLRLIRHGDLPSATTPTILGVDDFAWKKGRAYGTILVDLERHQVVDLLPDRSADSLAEWLLKHPGVKIISRDRGGAYAEGARRGAPDAEQVADRFHLLKNLREDLEPLLSREHAHLPKLVVPVKKVPGALAASNQVLADTATAISSAVLGNDDADGSAGGVPPDRLNQPIADETVLSKAQTRPAQIQHDRRERRHARYAEIIELRDQGTSIRSMAEQMGMARRTVRRYLASGTFPEIAQRRPMPSILDPFETYLRQRWQAGGHNAMQLYREIRAQGYPGSRPLVSRWAVQMRQLMPKPPAPAAPGQAAAKLKAPNRPIEKRRKLSPSQAAWLLVCQPADLTPEEASALQQMRQASSDIALAHDLAQDFGNLLRTHQAERLTAWLASAKKSCLAELLSCANGIERDLAAVMAGIALPWSNGQVEGQVNRLKFLKRAMYGRAKFDLLKHRVMAPT